MSDAGSSDTERADDEAVVALVGEASRGVNRARRELLEQALLQKGTTAALDPMLDALAAHAAAGEEPAIELLLEIVHRSLDRF